MQHIASPTLSWSATHQVYELSAGKLCEQLHLRIEDPAWFAWLDDVSSFAFHGQSGSYTARKETKQRGAVYWYAYRKTKGKLAKKYLGKTADLTLARLEDVAGVLHADRATAAQHARACPSTTCHALTARDGSPTRSRGGQCAGCSCGLTPRDPTRTTQEARGSAHPTARDQTAPASSPYAARNPLSPRRATPGGRGGRAHPRFSARRLRQNDAARPMAR